MRSFDAVCWRARCAARDADMARAVLPGGDGCDPERGLPSAFGRGERPGCPARQPLLCCLLSYWCGLVLSLLCVRGGSEDGAALSSRLLSTRAIARARGVVVHAPLRAAAALSCLRGRRFNPEQFRSLRWLLGVRGAGRGGADAAARDAQRLQRQHPLPPILDHGPRSLALSLPLAWLHLLLCPLLLVDFLNHL